MGQKKGFLSGFRFYIEKMFIATSDVLTLAAGEESPTDWRYGCKKAFYWKHLYYIMYARDYLSLNFAIASDLAESAMAI